MEKIKQSFRRYGKQVFFNKRNRFRSKRFLTKNAEQPNVSFNWSTTMHNFFQFNNKVSCIVIDCILKKSLNPLFFKVCRCIIFQWRAVQMDLSTIHFFT